MTVNNESGRERRELRVGEPCGHPGCLHHVSHPCEGCGRIAGGTIDTPVRIVFGSQEAKAIQKQDQEFQDWLRYLESVGTDFETLEWQIAKFKERLPQSDPISRGKIQRMIDVLAEKRNEVEEFSP